MNTATIIDEQIRQEICGEQMLLVRAQKPSTHEYNSPDIAAEWCNFRFCGNRLYSSNGAQTGRQLSVQEVDELFAMRPPLNDLHLNSEEDYWAQFADEYSLCSTHFATDPWILLLPAQHGKSCSAQWGDFFKRFW